MADGSIKPGYFCPQTQCIMRHSRIHDERVERERIEDEKILAKKSVERERMIEEWEEAYVRR